MATAHPHPAPSAPFSRITHSRPFAVVAAAAIAAAIWAVAAHLADVELLVPAGGGDTVELTLAPVLVVSLAAGLAGWGLAVLLASRVPRPRRVWTWMAGLVLVLSLLPVWLAVEGLASQLVLTVLHLAVAAVLIALLATTIPERRASAG